MRCRKTRFSAGDAGKEALLGGGAAKAGHTVAMTGDGVNDLLAMKQADCSIAFSSGAQAASQLGSLVLLNNDFAAMPGHRRGGAAGHQQHSEGGDAVPCEEYFLPVPVGDLPVHGLAVPLAAHAPDRDLRADHRHSLVFPRHGAELRPGDRAFSPWGVLRRAFPGGLTNVFAVLVCQAFMVVFDLPAESIATVCAAMPRGCGHDGAFQVCKPFGAFRRIVWGGMLVCLVVVFTCLGELFELRSGTVQTNLLC